MKRKMMIMASVLSVSLAVMLGGCGQRTGDEQPKTEAPKQTETELVTEAPTEAKTEKPTETEKQTETEKATEKITETEALTERVLTAEEEMAEEKLFETYDTMYAVDDVNVRSTPDTEGFENIILSYAQGQEVSVAGETPNWYIVVVEDYTGYVRKDGLSSTVVEPKSDEERQVDMEASDTDMAYGVSTFAEGYEVTVASDVNLRAEPTQSEDNIIGTIPAETVIFAIGETDEWYKVEYDGTVGYVNRNLIAG